MRTHILVSMYNLLASQLEREMATGDELRPAPKLMAYAMSSMHSASRMHELYCSSLLHDLRDALNAIYSIMSPSAVSPLYLQMPT